MNNITLKINTENGKTLQTVAITTQKGSATVVKQPLEKISFELVDDSTQLAPQPIFAKRNGNNLEIAFEDEKNSPSLIIEDYYSNDELSPVIGLAENHSYYAYFPQTGESADAIAALQQNVIAAEVLGGEAFVVPFLPNWGWVLAGLGIIGLGALVASSSSSSGGSSGSDSNTNTNNNEALNVAKTAIDAAKAADKAAKDALAEAQKDGNITAEEKADLQAKADEATAKKAAAENAIKALPDDNADKAGLTEEVGKLDGIQVPEVTPQEDPAKDAKLALEEAKAADKAAKDALAKANEDGKITETEKADLQAKAKDAADKKAAAENAIKALPDDNADKAGLTEEVGKLDGIQVPEVTPQEDPAKDAKLALEEAKAADKAAKDALAKANEDGKITETEKADLQAKADEAAAKKAAAENAIKALPDDNADKAGLTEEVGKLDGIQVPEVTPQEDPAKDAKLALEEAKAADKAAKDALAKANEDGKITETEKADLQAKADEAAAKKAAAENAIKALPDDNADKAGLTEEVGKLDGIQVPEVTPQEDPAKDAKLALEEAKAADKAAKDALAKANEDGKITETEKADLQAKADEAAAKKAAAENAIKALPDDNADKAGLTEEVGKLDGIQVPEVTPQEDPAKDAKLALEEAKAADKAAKDALAKANEDGNITAEEKADLQAKADEAAAKKAAAENAIKALPDDNADKAGLTEEVGKLDGIQVPEVTPQEDPAKDAKLALEEAKAADKAAKDALAKANEDGKITETEKADLQAKADEAAAKKAAAENAIKALPDDNADKAGLTEEVGKLDGIQVPEVTPQEDPAKDAKLALEEAKAADKAAKDALAKANEDGKITETEKADLQAKADEAAAKKAAAENAIKALPDDNADKAGLTEEVGKLDGIQVPEVTPQEDPAKDAKLALEEAKAADKAAKDALAKANEDGNITAEEKADLQAKADEAAAKKAAAENAIKALPDDNADKAGLTEEVGKLDGIQVPEVTPQEDPAKDAKLALEEAKAADKAAKDALAKANEDGKITETEKADLQAKADEAAAKKAAAENAIKALPDDNADKAGLTEEVGKLDGIQVPEVTPQEDPAKDAKLALEEAKAADKAAKDALAKANEDGNITAEEKADLQAKADEAAAKKAAAENAIKALPDDNADKAGLTEEVGKLDGIQVPEVTPQEDPAKDAKLALEEAKAADKAAKDALAKANEDGKITETEKADLQAKADEAAAKKAAAENAIKALPDDNADKAGLTEEVGKLDGIQVPEVTPQEDPAKDAKLALEEAKAADKAAKDALAKANEDGKITETEKADLQAKADEAAAKKAAAENAIKALPDDNADKAGLTEEVGKLDGIQVPEVTPQEDPAKDAKLALEEAKAADKAAKDALAKANEDGNITAEEKADLQAKADEAAAKKAAAENAIKALPDDNADKAGLTEEVGKLDGIQVPEVTPQEDPAKDAKLALEEAKAADKAAKDALAKANEDGKITETEKADLQAKADEAAAKKAAAENAIKALPDDNADKAGLTEEVGKLDGIQVPEVTPQEDPAKDAKLALEEAKAADKAAKDALAKANEDGNITAEEKADLQAKADEAAAKKAAAENAIKALPDDNADKAGLTEEVGKLDGIQVPEVTPPTDSNNWVDTTDWEEDTDTSDEPADKDLPDDKDEDDRPVTDPNVIITGRTVPNNPTKRVVDKIKEKNPLSADKIGEKGQINTGNDDDLVVVGKGTNANDISGKMSITGGTINTNAGKDKVIITNNAISTKINTGADEDKVDIYGNLRSTSATSNSVIQTGDGNDVLTVRGKLMGLNNQLDLEMGDDTVIIGGGALYNTAAANDVSKRTNWNKIDLGEGNDKLSMGERGAGNIQYTGIQAGTGDDTVILKPNRGKGDLFWVHTDLGDGNDNLVVEASDLRMTHIYGGDGNDTIDLSKAQFTTTYHTHVGDSSIDGGAGNDKIILGDVGYTTDAHYYRITGGAGNDVIEFTKDYSAVEYNNQGNETNAARNQTDIRGGEGFDTIAISGTGTTVNLHSGYSGAGTSKPEGLREFEAVDMTATGAQKVVLKASDVLANSGSTPLYISGDSNDTVDTKGTFTKGTEKVTHTALDGKEHTYTLYTSTEGAKLYIDDTITNII
ncbi:calcium-binding protein [Rodentibacter haemolyticus]|uniref:Calcium-binding protein n=1 Tax=Rodentibacter haemolyticus TaxID=2778911 RepID=A0ABX6UVY6_9PAST|nr:calcium-binding protein [Rodentibacter haemolyticus]QPB41899.1 calcium-binding protein [Rodentibacter haemolyticus]